MSAQVAFQFFSCLIFGLLCTSFLQHSRILNVHASYSQSKCLGILAYKHALPRFVYEVITLHHAFAARWKTEVLFGCHSVCSAASEAGRGHPTVSSQQHMICPLLAL